METEIEITKNDLLFNRIEQMVSMAGKVSLEQIFRMFRLYGETTVHHHVFDLAHKHKINFDDTKNTLTSRISPARKDSAQKMLTTAFWVLAAFGDERIEWYSPTELPVQLIWSTANTHQLFDVTYITPNYGAQTAESWYRAKKSFLPPTVKDETCDHIALVFNVSDAKTVMSYGFNRYCRLTEDKWPIFYPPIKGFEFHE